MGLIGKIVGSLKGHVGGILGGATSVAGWLLKLETEDMISISKLIKTDYSR